MSVKIHKNFFDIVILPPKEIRNYSIDLSQKSYKYNAKWVLSKKSFLPHISLYHIPIEEKKFDRFIAEIEKTVKGFKTGELKTTELKQYISKPIFANSLMINKPKWLREFYLKIIKKTMPYFDWNYGLEKLWKSAGWSKNMQKNFQKYGTPFVGKHFTPHITLNMFKNKNDTIKALNTLKFKQFYFRPKTIYVCKLGEGFSCQKIVKEIFF